MSDKGWDYRVVRSNKEDGTPTDWHSIQEIYYDDETGEPSAQTMDLQVEGENVDEMRKQLIEMEFALDKDVIDEIKSEVNEIYTDTSNLASSATTVDRMIAEVNPPDELPFKTTSSDDLPGDHGLEFKLEEESNLNQRVLNLEIENSDLKQMIREKDIMIEKASRGI